VPHISITLRRPTPRAGSGRVSIVRPEPERLPNPPPTVAPIAKRAGTQLNAFRLRPRDTTPTCFLPRGDSCNVRLSGATAVRSPGAAADSDKTVAGCRTPEPTPGAPIAKRADPAPDAGQSLPAEYTHPNFEQRTGCRRSRAFGCYCRLLPVPAAPPETGLTRAPEPLAGYGPPQHPSVHLARLPLATRLQNLRHGHNREARRPRARS